MTFGKILKQLRERNNYTMDKLVELYNNKFNGKMNKSTLSRYENGLQEPMYTVIVNLAKLFDVTVDFLSGASTEESPPLINEKIKARRKELGLTMLDVAKSVGVSEATVSRWESGHIASLKGDKILLLSKVLEVSPAFIMDKDFPTAPADSSLPVPEITNEYITFPVIGEIAAGYDKIAMEDWNGETIDIPLKFLHGRAKEDFFVLTVSGDSMYPLYHEGDKVLILKQNTLGRSGDIGAFMDEDGCATLKKIEYVQGEDWLKLIPLNLNYGPQLIEGEKLAHCRIIGIPRLLIREINS